MLNGKLCILLIIGCLVYSCADSGNRQKIDLSDRVVDTPADGVGHYVYALSLPETASAGEDFDIQMEWRTVGSVDPNARYTMDLRLSGPATKLYSVPSGANTVGELHLSNWLNYTFEIPASFPAGKYQVGIRLRDANRDLREVALGFEEELRLDDGFYRLAELTVTAE